jgi:hypothetical protein
VGITRSGSAIGDEQRDAQEARRQAGVPDALVWYRGKSVTIELK